MAKHQQEDPWAGFVDVLSNILMVVIFLVVILGISIFAISQQVTKAAVDKAVKAEREAQSETPRPTTPQAAKEPSQPPTTQQAASDGEKGAAGVYQAAQGLRARQSDEVAGDSNLSLRSTKLDGVKSIDVASEEVKASEGAVEVKTSQAFLTLRYQRGSFKIDEAASKEMGTFLAGANLPTTGKIEIRAFAQSTVGSVSEARRIAYYRAMQVRSELIKQGIAATRVELKLRESVSPEELDVVRIYAKPA